MQPKVVPETCEWEFRGHNPYSFSSFRLGRRFFSGRPVSFSLGGYSNTILHLPDHGVVPKKE